MREPAAMRRALDLAWRGWGRVHPNPMVGAVILDAEGTKVAEGWHAEWGGLHAETAALAHAGERARNGTVVVTLEPCDHEGKQPPCTGALLEAGVARVVAAMADPNPRSGGGAERLRAAGLSVEVGLMETLAARQNPAFLHAHHTPGRPWVALKLATSLDGRIADRDGISRWISGPEAREYVHWLRAGFDAIGVGGRTARGDRARLTVRGPVVPRVAPLRVLFDRLANLPDDLPPVVEAGDGRTILVAARAAPADRVTRLEALGLRALLADSPAEALAGLRAVGVGSLLIEGGGRLSASLLAADLVDRFYWIQSPLWLGAGAVEATPGLPDSSLADAVRWEVVERRELGADTLVVLDRPACSPA